MNIPFKISLTGFKSSVVMAMSAIVLGAYTLGCFTPVYAATLVQELTQEQTQKLTQEQTQDRRNELSLSSHTDQKSNTEIKGSLLIIGGALRSDNDAIWQKFIQQAGGKGARIAIIPTASANPVRSGNAVMATLKRYGAQAFVLPLSVNDQQHSYLDVVKDPKVIESLSKVSGIYFTGGDQGRITQALVQKSGQKTPLLEAIWDIYRRGGVIAGTSAGAAIMSETMFYDARSTMGILKSGAKEGQDIAPGLGFIGPDIFVDQHLIIRGRFARMIPVMLQKKYKIGLGIDENSAMLISQRNKLEVLGYKGAILVDLQSAVVNSDITAFNVSNVRLSYLDSGDQFDLKQHVLTPANDKLSGKLEQSKNLIGIEHNALIYNDILANTVVVDLMQKLMDSPQQKAIGLAFETGKLGKNQQAELGFEFTLSKVPESTAYYSSATGHETYTVEKLRLDIMPVKMNLPLYVPITPAPLMH